MQNDAVESVTSSTNYSVTSTALLTVAGVDYPFSVTTGGDFVPDAFSFVTSGMYQSVRQVTSNSITITGISRCFTNQYPRWRVFGWMHHKLY